MTTTPHARPDPRYGEPDAPSVSWVDDVLGVLERGRLWMFTSLRSDGRPHTCPLLAVWHEGALHMTTGPEEQKFVNLAADRRVTVSISDGRDDRGLDVVVEGTAARSRDRDLLATLARRWSEKYGATWDFDVDDQGFVHDGHESAVFAVVPSKILVFTKAPYSQTAFVFGADGRSCSDH